MPTGIELLSGVLVGAPKPLDAKFGPYQTVNAALQDLPANIRHQGLTVGVLDNGSVVEYWFKDGIDASNFVVKASPASTASGTVKSVNTVQPDAAGNVSINAANIGAAGISHAHQISQVTGLQTALDSKAAADHSHQISQVTGLQTALDSKAAGTHLHSITQVTGLQTALDSKAEETHSHTIEQVAGLQTALDALGSVSNPFVFTVTASGQSIPTGYPVVKVKVAVPPGSGDWTLNLSNTGPQTGDEIYIETGLVDGSSQTLTLLVDGGEGGGGVGGGGGGGGDDEIPVIGGNPNTPIHISTLSYVQLRSYETLVARFVDGRWRQITRDTFVSPLGRGLAQLNTLEGITFNEGYNTLSVQAKNLVNVTSVTVPEVNYIFPDSATNRNLRLNITTSGPQTVLRLPYLAVQTGDRIEIWLVDKAGAGDAVTIRQSLVPDTVENGTIVATLDTVGQSALFIREDSGWVLYPTRVHDHDERYYTEDETDTLLARKVADYGPPTWVRTSSRDNSPSDLGIVAAISWDGVVWHSTTKSKLFPANSFSRDASVFWHQLTSRWVCFSTNAFNGTKSFQVATSPDLRTWTVITVPLAGPLTAGTANNTWLNHHFIDNGNYYALVRLSTTAGNNYGAPGCGYTRCLNPGTWTQWTDWTPFDSTVRVDANEMCIIKKGDLYHMFSLPGTHLNLTPPGLPNYYDIHVQTSTEPFGGYSAPVSVTAPARAALGSFFIEGCDIVHIKGDHYRLYFQEGVTNEAWVWDSYDGMQTWDLESLRALQYIGLDGRGHGTVTRVTTQNIRSIQATIRQLAEPSPHTHPNATTTVAGFMSPADKTKLDGIASTPNTSNYIHPNHTGDVTSVGDGATTISDDVVTNAKLANVAPATIKGRSVTASGVGDPEDLTASQVRTILNVADGAEANVNADWNATTGDAQILNKPNVESQYVTTSLSVFTSQTLGAGRAQLFILNVLTSATVTLPTTGVQIGDRLIIRGGSPMSSTAQLSSTGISDSLTSTNQQYSYVYGNVGGALRWIKNFVDVHTHTASDITSGVLDFDRIQAVVEAQTESEDSNSPDSFDLGTSVVGGNLHALALVSTSVNEGHIEIILPALASTAVGKVTVRAINFLQGPSARFIKIVLDDAAATPIWPAISYTEMDPGEEITFRWNNNRWEMDLRANPLATTAQSIFKPNASGTLALTSELPDDSRLISAIQTRTTYVRRFAMFENSGFNGNTSDLSSLSEASLNARGYYQTQDANITWAPRRVLPSNFNITLFIELGGVFNDGIHLHIRRVNVSTGQVALVPVLDNYHITPGSANSILTLSSNNNFLNPWPGTAVAIEQLQIFMAAYTGGNGGFVNNFIFSYRV